MKRSSQNNEDQVTSWCETVGEQSAELELLRKITKKAESLASLETQTCKNGDEPGPRAGHPGLHHTQDFHK